MTSFPSSLVHNGETVRVQSSYVEAWEARAIRHHVTDSEAATSAPTSVDVFPSRSSDPDLKESCDHPSSSTGLGRANDTLRFAASCKSYQYVSLYQQTTQPTHPIDVHWRKIQQHQLRLGPIEFLQRPFMPSAWYDTGLGSRSLLARGQDRHAHVAVQREHVV